MKRVDFIFKTDFSGGEKNSDNAYEHKKDYFATATTEAEQKTNSSCLCASSYGSFFADACVSCIVLSVEYTLYSVGRYVLVYTLYI